MSSTSSTAAEGTPEAATTVKCSRQERGEDDECGKSQAANLTALQAGMAADIAELRAILMAAAKHFKIELPRPDNEPLPSQVSVDFESIKPTGEGYDEEITVSRHFALLPTEDTLLSISGWDKWPLDKPSWGKAKPVFQSQNWRDFPEGLQPIMEWWLHGRISADVAEFGYTTDGYPCQLGTNWDRYRPHLGLVEFFKEHTYIADKDMPSAPSWFGQRFGKEWMFPLHSSHNESSATAIALAVCQLLDRHSNMSNNPSAQHFFESFQREWPRLSLPSSRPASGFAWNQDLFVLHYHMRLLSVSEQRNGAFPVRGLKRAHGRIRTRGVWRHLYVTERRISIAVKTTCDDLPTFSLVLLTDLGNLDRPKEANPSQFLVDLDSRSSWDELGIRPAIRQTGISALAFRVHTLCSCWAAEWDSTLKAFESHINVEVQDILNRQKRIRLMYDESDLVALELYFFMSQILRFAASWIQESVSDLRTLVQHLETEHFSVEAKLRNPAPEASFLPDSPEAQRAAIEMFRQNWESVLSHQSKLADALLQRIEKKQAEVSSLRDALCTATSINETGKSKRVNYFIIVFTLVTIFFLPLTFVTSLFALDLFSWDDPNQKIYFIVTLLLVAGTTYHFSTYIIVFVDHPTTRQLLKYLFRNPRKTIRELHGPSPELDGNFGVLTGFIALKRVLRRAAGAGNRRRAELAELGLQDESD